MSEEVAAVVDIDAWRSQSLDKLAPALATVQSKLHAAVKDSVNPGFRGPDGKATRYADLASVWEACRALLGAAKIAVVQRSVGDADRGVIAIHTLLLHEDQWISGTMEHKLSGTKVQDLGSAITYLKRYSLTGMVGVVTDDDDDGNEASKPKPGKKENVQSPQERRSPAQLAMDAQAPATPSGERAPSKEDLTKEIGRFALQICGQQASKDEIRERLRDIFSYHIEDRQGCVATDERGFLDLRNSSYEQLVYTHRVLAEVAGGK